MSGHCKDCGKRRHFCDCEPLIPPSAAVMGVVCTLLAMLLLCLFKVSGQMDNLPRHGYSRPPILGPEPDTCDGVDHLYDDDPEQDGEPT